MAKGDSLDHPSVKKFGSIDGAAKNSADFSKTMAKAALGSAEDDGQKKFPVSK
jgi:hypothetical protein